MYISTIYLSTSICSAYLYTFIVKPKSKSQIPCPNRPLILTLSPDQF